MTRKELREKRINDITTAAIAVFLDKGYENTTMEAIAQKAGVSKGGLYHYFKSKDMILIFTNQKISEDMEKMMVTAGTSTSVKEGLLFYIENYLRYWPEHPQETSFLFLSVAKILDNQALLEYYHQFTGDYLKFFEEAFARGVESGEFIPHNIKTSALTLVAAMDGIISYLVLSEDLVMDEVIQQFTEKFITPIEVQMLNKS